MSKLSFILITALSLSTSVGAEEYTKEERAGDKALALRLCGNVTHCQDIVNAGGGIVVITCMKAIKNQDLLGSCLEGLALINAFIPRRKEE